MDWEATKQAAEENMRYYDLLPQEFRQYVKDYNFDCKGLLFCINSRGHDYMKRYLENEVKRLQSKAVFD